MKEPIDKLQLLRDLNRALEYYPEEFKPGLLTAKSLVSSFPQDTTLSPCDMCAYDPPQSYDGKPCRTCPARPMHLGRLCE